jgi:hypothetical protein
MRWEEIAELEILFRLKLVNLLNMNSQPASGVQSPRTHVALEMFGLLVLH